MKRLVKKSALQVRLQRHQRVGSDVHAGELEQVSRCTAGADVASVASVWCSSSWSGRDKQSNISDARGQL